MHARTGFLSLVHPSTPFPGLSSKFGPTRTNRIRFKVSEALFYCTVQNAARSDAVWPLHLCRVGFFPVCSHKDRSQLNGGSQVIRLPALYGRSTRIAALAFNGVWGKGEGVPRRRRNRPQRGVRRLPGGRAKAREEDRSPSYPLAVATLPSQFLRSYEYRKREGISLLSSVQSETLSPSIALWA